MTTITGRFGVPARRARRTRSEVAPRAAVGAGTAQVVLWVVVLTLNAVGLAMVLSASSVSPGEGSVWSTGQRQIIWFGLGLVALLVTRQIDYRRWASAVPFVLGASLVGLVAVLVPGIGASANGSQRWIPVGPITIQPAELAKLALILYLARLLADRHEDVHVPRLSVHPALMVLGIMGALLLRQPDLGSLLLLGGIAFAMLFAGGAPSPSLARWAGFAAVAAGLLAYVAPYRRRRLLAFLDPWDDPLDTGYQTIQSMVGIASGRLMGVGIGEGRAKWGYLPFAHTDFIYAVVAEEMGFGGAALVLGLFIVLAGTGCRIALHAKDHFGRLLVVGITVWLVLQALVNIGAVVGTLPITGVPLPFVSFGGTALVTSMAAVGVMMNVSRQTDA